MTILRYLLWKAFSFLAVPLAILAVVYGWWVLSRLDGTLAAEEVRDYSRFPSLVVPAESPVETSLPRVLRVRVTRQDGHNWLPSPSGDLVHGTYDWDMFGNKWLEVPVGFEDQARVGTLRLIEVYTIPKLIDVLEETDAHRRQVAVTELRLRTQQNFGYRYDSPAGTQADAVNKWRSWWTANKIKYSKDKVIDAVEELLK